MPPALPRPPTALLWDLDNADPGAARLGALARTLSSLVGAGAPRIAAAHRGLYRRYHGPLTATGVEVLSGGRRRNGADAILMHHARLLRRAGIRSFVVVSNDHLFAAIGRRADLHVVTLRPASVSRDLYAAARSVTVLQAPEGRDAGRAAGAPRRQIGASLAASAPEEWTTARVASAQRVVSGAP
ncbi:hypothetical protein [Modestobacter sp. SYSU DS0875]